MRPPLPDDPPLSLPPTRPVHPAGCYPPVWSRLDGRFVPPTSHMIGYRPVVRGSLFVVVVSLHVIKGVWSRVWPSLVGVTAGVVLGGVLLWILGSVWLTA